MSDVSFGIDLGGSHITAVAVNYTSGVVIEKASIQLNEDERKSPDYIIDRIVE